MFTCLQPVTFGTWTPWTWSPWQASRRCRRPPPWLWVPTLHPCPPWSTSKYPLRESPSPTTRGSEYCMSSTVTNTHTYLKIILLSVGNEENTVRSLLSLKLCLSSFRLFFRRHYHVNTVIYCALDPQDRKWVWLNISSGNERASGS